MNKSYIEWIDYYENATKEDVIQDMMLDINSIKEKDKEIERLKNIIDELILECYNCDMTFGEFKNIWKKAYNKEYNSKDLDKLKELKGETNERKDN